MVIDRQYSYAMYAHFSVFARQRIILALQLVRRPCFRWSIDEKTIPVEHYFVKNLDFTFCFYFRIHSTTHSVMLKQATLLQSSYAANPKSFTFPSVVLRLGAFGNLHERTDSQHVHNHYKSCCRERN